MQRLASALERAREHATKGREQLCNRAMRAAYMAHIDCLDAIAEAHGYSADMSERELEMRDAVQAMFDTASDEIDALLGGS